jgi:hypothetical protein
LWDALGVIKLPVGLRDIKSNHSGLAVPHCPIIPPRAVVTGVGLPSGEMMSVINMVGQTPNMMGLQNPVSSSEVLVGLGLYIK